MHNWMYNVNANIPVQWFPINCTIGPNEMIFFLIKKRTCGYNSTLRTLLDNLPMQYTKVYSITFKHQMLAKGELIFDLTLYILIWSNE